MRRLRRALAPLALAALVTAGPAACGPTLRTAGPVDPATGEAAPTSPPRPGETLPVERIRVEPFAIEVPAPDRPGRGEEPPATPGGPEQVVGHVVAALRARGLEAGPRVPAGRADAVLGGRVRRYEERSGGKLGTGRAAAVTVEVELRRPGSGALLWAATFDERQQPLSENLLNAFRYPGGGLRWLTADELARWAAEEIADAMPRQVPAP